MIPPDLQRKIEEQVLSWVEMLTNDQHRMGDVKIAWTTQDFVAQGGSGSTWESVRNTRALFMWCPIDHENDAYYTMERRIGSVLRPLGYHASIARQRTTDAKQAVRIRIIEGPYAQ